MLEKYPFDQALYWVAHIQNMINQSEPNDHVSQDQIELALQNLQYLKQNHCNHQPVVFDPALIASVYQNIKAMATEIRNDIFQNLDSDEGVARAIARMDKIMDWHESDGDPRSIRIDAIFEPLFTDDPSDRTEFYKAQDCFVEELDRLSLELARIQMTLPVEV